MRMTKFTTQASQSSSVNPIARWKVFFQMLLVVTMVVSLFPSATATVFASTEDVTYLDESAQTQTHEEVTVIDEDNYQSISELDGWYLFRGTWRKSSSFTVESNATIILEDDSNITITGDIQKAGINVENGKSLTILAQSTGLNMGKLKATGGYDAAGIGGGLGISSGTVTIYGGNIVATGGDRGSAIGGGMFGTGGTVTIYGGDITAIASSLAMESAAACLVKTGPSLSMVFTNIGQIILIMHLVR